MGLASGEYLVTISCGHPQELKFALDLMQLGLGDRMVAMDMETDGEGRFSCPVILKDITLTRHRLGAKGEEIGANGAMPVAKPRYSGPRQLRGARYV